MRLRLARAAAVAAAVLLAGSRGPAYLTIRDDSTGASILWKLTAPAANLVGGKVTYYVDAASAVDVTPEQFADAARAAVDAWGAAPGTAIAFAEDPARPATQKSLSDRVNRIGFSPGLLGPGVLGKTYTLWSGTRVLETDVVLNPDLGSAEFGWSVQSPGDSWKADIQGVVAHEWGHALGLAHVPLQHSTMFYSAPLGGVSLRSLEPDDLAAVSHAYPGPAHGTSFGTIRGRVDVAGAFDDRGIQVTAIEVVSGLPAVSSFTAPDGSYAVDGLPPGAYRVVASPVGTLYVNALVYNSAYWDSSVTEVLPSVLTEDGAPGSPSAVLVVAAGQTISDVDLVVAAADSPQEPDNSLLAATPLLPGRSVAGRMESGSDHDFYSFQGTAGRRVSVFVHAGQIGSDLDPRLYLRGADGLVVAGTGDETDDISSDSTSPEGKDYDSRIVEFVLPETGAYYVEVESVRSVSPSRVEDFFYVLTLLESGGVPSPATSEFSASPAVLAAAGGGTAALLFRPRAADGMTVGPGLDVSMALVPDDALDDGLLSTVTDLGDGTYSAVLAAAAIEGNDTVTALVDGVPIASVAVDYLGGPDLAASGFRSEPRRIRFDGASTTRLIFVPRDSHGVPYGPGRTTGLSEAGIHAASIGSTVDEGDGSYEATLTAGLVPESVGVAAEVDGVGISGAFAVDVGFPLEPCVDDGAADLDAALAAVPPPFPKAAVRLAKARKALLAAGLLSAADAPKTILSKITAALKQLEAAAKKGEPMAALARELTEAAREKARGTTIAAAPIVDLPPEIRAYERATAALAAGDAFIDAGLWSKAAARYLVALKHALKIR